MPASRARTRDLLGAVGVAVETGLADEELEPAPERLADPLDLVVELGEILARRRRVASPTPVGARYSPNTLAQRLRPLAGRDAGAGGGDRRRHDVLSGSSRRPRRAHASAASTAAWSRSARQRSSGGAALAPRPRGRRRGSRRRRRRSAARARSSSKRFIPTTVCSPDSIRRQRSRWDSTSARLHVVDGLDGAAELRRRAPSPSRAPATSSATRPSITCEPSKMSAYSSRSVS